MKNIIYYFLLCLVLISCDNYIQPEKCTQMLQTKFPKTIVYDISDRYSRRYILADTLGGVYLIKMKGDTNFIQIIIKDGKH